MTLVLLYLAGALLDGAKRLAGTVLCWAAWAVAVVLTLLLLDGCSPQGWASADRVLVVGVFGLALGVLLVALAVPKLRARLLALAAGLGGLGFLLGFLGLGRRGRAERRQEVGEARRDAVRDRKDQRKADKAESGKVERIEDSMGQARDQAAVGSDEQIDTLIDLGTRRRRERGAGGDEGGAA